MGDDLKRPECPVCHESFDARARAPQSLRCQHIFCYLCLRDLFTVDKGIQCPLCREVTFQAPDFLPNHTPLLRLLFPESVPFPPSSSSLSHLLLSASPYPVLRDQLHSALSTFFSTASTPPSPVCLSRPTALALHPCGDILLSDFDQGLIWRFSSLGGPIESFSPLGRGCAPLLCISGLCVFGDLLLVVDSNHGELIQLQLDTWTLAARFGLSPLRFPFAVCAIENRIFVSDPSCHSLAAFTVSGQLLCRAGGEGDRPGQFRRPSFMCASPKGTLLIADQYNHRIQEMDLNLKPIRVLEAQLKFPAGIYWHEDRLLVADRNHGRVVSLSANGKQMPVTEASGLSRPEALLVNGDTLFVVEAAEKRIRRIVMPPLQFH